MFVDSGTAALFCACASASGRFRRIQPGVTGTAVSTGFESGAGDFVSLLSELDPELLPAPEELPSGFALAFDAPALLGAPDLVLPTIETDLTASIADFAGAAVAAGFFSSESEDISTKESSLTTAALGAPEGPAEELDFFLSLFGFDVEPVLR